MSVARTAIRRRRMAKHDERYIGTKKDAGARARRLARLIQGEKERMMRKGMKK